MEQVLAYKEAFAKASKNQKILWDFFSIFCASFLMILFSCIKIPLFFTPIPLVLQNSVAVFLGASLGSKKGTLAVLLFLLYGCCHLGTSTLFSPDAVGYLFGYAAAAFITGTILEKTSFSYFSAILAGHLTILILGTGFLAMVIGLKQAFCLGFVPFIVPDILKTIVLTKAKIR